MSTADDVKGQFMGGSNGSKAGNTGWEMLAPQPDNEGRRWSQGIKKDVDRSTIVEGMATLIFEATYRIKAVTDVEEAKKRAVDAKLGETVLGHAAIASGLSVTNNDLLRQILAEVKK